MTEPSRVRADTNGMKIIDIERYPGPVFHVVYYGVRGPTGQPLRSRCVSPKSARAAIKRMTKKHGQPDKITGRELLTES